jgi:hypothetical protein
MYRGAGNNGRYRNRGTGRGGANGRQQRRPRGLFADGIWHCDCTPRLPAERFKVKKEGKNQGRWFYTCQQSDNGCGFFLWEDDAKPREEAAVLSGKRSEPQKEGVQEGWNAGRSRQEQQPPERKGLFQNNPGNDRDESTASPSPPPSYRSEASGANRTKRSAMDAELEDDGFDLDNLGENELARIENGLPPETPHKAQKAGVYATPATTGKRKLPWLEESKTPSTATTTNGGYFDTPSKQPMQSSSAIETPTGPATIATASSPSPPTRFKDALHNPADSSSSLTSEVLAALSSVKLPKDVLEQVRSICTKHDLRNQGIVKGRDISRLALKAKDAKITELQARMASLEADREVERNLGRMKRWDSESRGD